MNCLLSVCDFIVEFAPVIDTLTDGTTIEIMKTRPRTDLYINLPALRKLDSLLLVRITDYIVVFYVALKTIKLKQTYRVFC